MYRLVIILCLCACAVFAGEKRMWKDNKGRTMEGEFVRFDGDYVILKRSSNGKGKRVKIMSLSSADRGYLAKIQSGDVSTGPGSRGSNRTSDDSGTEITIVGDVMALPNWQVYTGLAILGIVNIALALGLGKVIFGGWREFGRCIMFWFQPDWISRWRGEGFEDFISTFKIFFFILIMIGAVIGQFILIGMVIG